MGKKLEEFYKLAKEIGGIRAQIRLAVLTLISIPRSRDAPDSDENIYKFHRALRQIREEFRSE
jgi:hypothetical protein